jgi:SAM-dependent methyltransferase
MTQSDSLQNAYLKADSLDVVRMYHVLEHVYDPKSEIKSTYNILKKHGQLFIGVPNFDSIYRKIFGRYFFALQLPTHISHFNKYTIRKLLEDEGFTVQKIKTGGWFGLAQSLKILLQVKTGFILPNIVLFGLTIIFLPISFIVLIFDSGPVMNIHAFVNK